MTCKHCKKYTKVENLDTADHSITKGFCRKCIEQLTTRVGEITHDPSKNLKI